MKISDSQLRDVRRLYKKYVNQKKVEASEMQETLASRSSDSATAASTTASSSVASTNYDELHQAIERRKIDFAARAVAEAPDIRQERVDAIKAQIAQGSYKIDAEAIAERMISSGLYDEFVG